MRPGCDARQEKDLEASFVFTNSFSVGVGTGLGVVADVITATTPKFTCSQTF